MSRTFAFAQISEFLDDPGREPIQTGPKTLVNAVGCGQYFGRCGLLCAGSVLES